MRRSRVPKRKDKGGLVEVSELLEGALKQLGVRGDFEKFRVEKKCRELLGEKFSKALTRVVLKAGVVRLEFNHSIWMNEVSFRKSEILRALQKEIPEAGIKSLGLALATRAKN